MLKRKPPKKKNNNSMYYTIATVCSVPISTVASYLLFTVGPLSKIPKTSIDVAHKVLAGSLMVTGSEETERYGWNHIWGLCELKQFD